MVWPSGEDIAKGGGVLLVDGAVVDVVGLDLWSISKSITSMVE